MFDIIRWINVYKTSNDFRQAGTYGFVRPSKKPSSSKVFFRLRLVRIFYLHHILTSSAFL